MALHRTWDLIRETVARFGGVKAPRLAASLAYTAIFALAPLFVLLIAIAGSTLAFGHGQSPLEDQLLAAVGRAAGAQAAQAARDMVSASFAHRGQSVLAQVVGWVTLVIGAGALFAALQDALNTVWHVEEPKKKSFRIIVRDRLVPFAMLVAIGVVLIAGAVVDAALAILAGRTGAAPLVWLVNGAVSFAILTVLFALIYRFLPDTRVDWRDVWIGALVTALLFAIGQSAIGLYLSHAGIASAYGAAGSLLALLVWVYYSALILLFGAAFTSVNAERRARATSGPRPSRSPAASSTSARTAAPGGRY